MTIVSASLTHALGAHGSFKPTFSPLPVSDTTYYDDGPPALRTKATTSDSLSGSMGNLSSSYPFVQGVEITKQSQYDAGTVKIWSGEPQHRLSLTAFGQGKTFFADPGFVEMDLFDPVRYLRAQEAASPLFNDLLTFPIVTGDNDQLENLNFDGIIEPLSIRPIVAFFSIDTPFEAHTVRATLMAGNTNQVGGTERVLTVDYYEPDRQVVGYLDMVDIIDGHPLNGFFRHAFTTNLPFVDERLVRNDRRSSADDPEMVETFSEMTGSTDSYVHHNQRSATCGWYYDNNGAGTDSLAFGGMMH